MNPATGFTAFFLLTLMLLAAVAATGLRARRRWHLTFVALSFGSLGVAIYYAKQLGQVYDLESAGRITAVHLTLAKVATFSFLLPVLSGIATVRNRANIVWHRRLAWSVLSMTVLSALTGVWMILAAKPF
ncbi:MAG: hypothetical protein CMJ89_06625 [Planctomycetes bacterium]|nr:hypothetical protein [Planctomycetota bacterium]